MNGGGVADLSGIRHFFGRAISAKLKMKYIPTLLLNRPPVLGWLFRTRMSTRYETSFS